MWFRGHQNRSPFPICPLPPEISSGRIAFPRVEFTFFRVIRKAVVRLLLIFIFVAAFFRKVSRKVDCFCASADQLPYWWFSLFSFQLLTRKRKYTINGFAFHFPFSFLNFSNNRFNNLIVLRLLCCVRASVPPIFLLSLFCLPFPLTHSPYVCACAYVLMWIILLLWFSSIVIRNRDVMCSR